MSGTIVVDRIESDASYASSINIASPLVVANTTNFTSNVGIGTSTPNAKLQVIGGTTSGNVDVASIFSGGVSGVIGSGAAIHLTSTSSTTRGATIAGINSTGGGNGHDLVFSTSASTQTPAERMRLTYNGYLRMPSGSGGIQFGGDTAAANALDDYEEGTFTPTALGASSAGTTTYNVQQGSYTKIGRQVTVSVRLDYSALTGTGELRLGGLPFTSSNDSMEYIGPVMTNNLNWVGGTTITTYVIPNSTQAVIFCSTDDNPWASQQCVNESAGIRFTAIYFTA